MQMGEGGQFPIPPKNGYFRPKTLLLARFGPLCPFLVHFHPYILQKHNFQPLLVIFFWRQSGGARGGGVPHNYDFWQFFSLNSVKHIWELELWNFTKVSSRSQLLLLHVELTTEILGEDVIYERRK